MSPRAVFTQTAISRALKACKAAGVPVRKFEIGREGNIIIYPGTALTDDEPANEWDEVLTDAPKT